MVRPLEKRRAQGSCVHPCPCLCLMPVLCSCPLCLPKPACICVAVLPVWSHLCTSPTPYRNLSVTQQQGGAPVLCMSTLRLTYPRRNLSFPGAGLNSVDLTLEKLGTPLEKRLSSNSVVELNVCFSQDMKYCEEMDVTNPGHQQAAWFYY